jgi:Cu-Zn family superoxide dismutase
MRAGRGHAAAKIHGSYGQRDANADAVRCSRAAAQLVYLEDLMKIYVAMLATAVVVICTGTARADIVTVNAINATGVGKVIGTIGLSDANEGLVVMPDLAELPPGDHGFHIHVNPDCGPGAGPDGQPAAGLAAGGHYDPANSGKHLGPHGQGQKGDLPALRVDAGGNAMTAVIAPHLKLADVKGRSIMIHAGGDNYSDQPSPLGGGGAHVSPAGL